LFQLNQLKAEKISHCREPGGVDCFGLIAVACRIDWVPVRRSKKPTDGHSMFFSMRKYLIAQKLRSMGGNLKGPLYPVVAAKWT
jgi:hypothetical protein